MKLFAKHKGKTYELEEGWHYKIYKEVNQFVILRLPDKIILSSGETSTIICLE